VNVLNDPQRLRRLGLTGSKKSDKAPSLMNALVQSLYIMEYEIIRASILKADILIEPDVSGIEPYEFYRGADAIEAGYTAAKAVLPEIIRMLNESIELVEYLIHFRIDRYCQSRHDLSSDFRLYYTCDKIARFACLIQVRLSTGLAFPKRPASGRQG
jgi:hypothetical protein